MKGATSVLLGVKGLISLIFISIIFIENSILLTTFFMNRLQCFCIERNLIFLFILKIIIINKNKIEGLRQNIDRTENLQTALESAISWRDNKLCHLMRKRNVHFETMKWIKIIMFLEDNGHSLNVYIHIIYIYIYIFIIYNIYIIYI